MTYFSSRDPACRTPFGALAAGEEVRFALRAGWQEGAGWLLLFADGAWEEPAAVPLQESGTLETVLFGLGQTVSLVYKTDEPISKDHAYFQVWLDKDGNLTACPDDENGSDG